VPARGVLYIHSCPPAICPHLEWAVASVLGVPVRLTWTPQPMAPGTWRGEAGWRGPGGTAGRIAAALRGWSLRFEVTEDPSDFGDGERYAVTPALGVFRAPMSLNGDVLIDEERIRALLASTVDPAEVVHGLSRLLGDPWDDELEPFRQAGAGAPVRWLTATG
jgi:hypothetical protein